MWGFKWFWRLWHSDFINFLRSVPTFFTAELYCQDPLLGLSLHLHMDHHASTLSFLAVTQSSHNHIMKKRKKIINSLPVTLKYQRNQNQKHATMTSVYCLHSQRPKIRIVQSSGWQSKLDVTVFLYLFDEHVTIKPQKRENRSLYKASSFLRLGAVWVLC